MRNLHSGSTNPNLFVFDGSSSKSGTIDAPEFHKKQATRLVNRVSKISLPDGCLNAGNTMSCTMWVQGREQSGISREELLFYYESYDESPSMR